MAKQDRVCIEEGCSTRLVVFNPGPACYMHTERVVPVGHSSKRTVEQREAAAKYAKGQLHFDRLTRAERGAYRSGEWMGPSSGEAS